MTQDSPEMRTVTAVVARTATITDVVVVEVPADTDRDDLEWAVESAANSGEGQWQGKQRITFGDEAWQLSATETPERYLAVLAAESAQTDEDDASDETQPVWVLEMQQPDDECRVIGVYPDERAAIARLAGELTELWPTYISEDMDRFPWQTMFADHSAWCDEVIDRFTAAETDVAWRVVAHPVGGAVPTCGSW